MRTQIGARIHTQLKEQIGSTLGVYVCSFFYVATTLLFPVLLSELIEQIADGGIEDKENVLWCVVVLLVGECMLFLSGWIRENAGNKFSYALREYIWGHNLHASYADYRNRDTDADFQIVTMDSSAIGAHYFKTLPGIFISGLISVGALAGICTRQDEAGVLFVSVCIFLSILFVVFLLKRVELYECQYVEERSHYFSYLVKVMEEIRTLKLFALYQKVSARIREMGVRVTGKSLKAARVEYIQKNLLQLMQYVLLVYGLLVYVTGEMRLSEFLLFEQYVNILSAQMMSLIMHLDDCKKKNVIEQKLEEMLLSEERYGNLEKESIQKIDVKNITFSYEEGPKMYQGFSCEFQQGKCYLLKAPNGFGKSTLFELLVGIERPSAGKILYDDVEMSEINLARVRRRQICFLQQNDLFYGENLQENIDDYLDNIRLEELKPYMKRMNLELEEREGDFNTILSGGQKKKLSLAMMMKKADNCIQPIILLDEPTNMLDQSSIETVVSYVRDIKRKAMVLIISHDSQFDMVADETVQLDKEGRKDD